jgi:glycosyltransferase involved in cell wall biosynthesis
MARPAEMVSSILPTRDRPRFFRQALRYFERQSYPNRELVVVDDGENPVGKWCEGRERVRYLRLERVTPLGTKMNLGIERARGSILVKTDDDDYYHPEFLGAAAARLRQGKSDRQMVAWDCFLVLVAGEEELRFSGHGWAAGGTLCFSRRLWERAPFRDVPKSVDRWFLEDHGCRCAGVCEPEMYILVRHGRNTWTRMDTWETDDWLRRQPVHHKAIEELMPPEDARFYRRLRYQGNATSGLRP